MKVSELAEKLSLQVLSNHEGLGRNIRGGYVSDMLSDVMANSSPGNIWITLQTHPNIVAVAHLKDLSGIIIVGNRQPEEETLKKAASEGITIMQTAMAAFETAGRVHKLFE